MERCSVDSIAKNIVSESNLVTILRVIGWANLVLGVIGSIFIWKTFGTIEVPYYFISGTHTETNPIGIALGFVSLIEGIVGWALLLVVASTAENVINIKKKLDI